MGFHINENVEHLQPLQGFSRKGLIWVTFNAIHCRLSESLIMVTEYGSMVKPYIQMWQHYKSSLKTKLWDFCWNKDPQAHIWPFWMNQEWLGGHPEWMSTRAFCPTKMQTQYWPYSSPEAILKATLRVFLGSLIQLTSSFILLHIRGLGSCGAAVRGVTKNPTGLKDWVTRGQPRVFQLLSRRGQCSKLSWHALNLHIYYQGQTVESFQFEFH